MPKIIWDVKANRQLNKLNPFIARRLIREVDELKENPFSKDIKKLTNTHWYRLRIGDYRVIFGVERESIRILRVGHRKNIYNFK